MLCRHFGTCGGCVSQDQPDAGAAAKIARVTAALTTAGYAPPSVPLLATQPFTRRRMDLALRREPSGRIVIGLHAARSTSVVDLLECRVLDPRLFEVLAPLRTLLRSLSALRREGSLVGNLLDSGPDLLLRFDGGLQPADRTRLATFAATHGLARITAATGDRGEPEIACQLRPAVHRFGTVVVEPPPGVFLQASPTGEAAIVAAVLDALPQRLARRDRIAELFAGCGTLTFPLAGRAGIDAFEGDAASVAALQRAANHAGQSGRVVAARRDLKRRPLTASELARYAAVVIDPPYAGAGTQINEIADTGRPVVYVSCNPASLARDATVLRAAGYRLGGVTAVDQFLWSEDIESVCAFAR